MNKYRTHLCSELNISNLNEQVTLSGWVDTIRDHGNLLFIDLRDNYGITQCVVDAKHQSFGSISIDILSTISIPYPMRPTLFFGLFVNNIILLADEISPDSCRLWDKRFKKSYDKDLFRENKGDLIKAYKKILKGLDRI